MWTIILKILVTLILGFLLGYFKIIPPRLHKYTQWIITGGLVILLISMGAGVSSNPEILNKISQLGLKALLLALSSVIGSILLVWLLERYLFAVKKGDEEECSG